MDGAERDAEKTEDGWRWTFVTPNGAYFMSPGFYKTRKQALAACAQWEEENS